MANLKDDRDERFQALIIAEHRVCAREQKLLKTMVADGRCGWYMAAELLCGDSRHWQKAKSMLIDFAAADYYLFFELRMMTAEERAAYFTALRALHQDSEQQFDLTMLRVLGWILGAPIKVLSAVPAYDNSVYASEYAGALCEARAMALLDPVCVVYTSLLRRDRCGLQQPGRHCNLSGAARDKSGVSRCAGTDRGLKAFAQGTGTSL